MDRQHDPHGVGERVWKAAHAIATTDRLLKRMKRAALALHPLYAEEFPADLRAEFASIQRTLIDEQQSIDQLALSADDAREMARRIKRLDEALGWGRG